jgi:methylated-DNA-[protein]-cysteine S-methyltransferase
VDQTAGIGSGSLLPRCAVSIFPSELGWIALVGIKGRARALSFGHISPVDVRQDVLRRLRLPGDVLDEDWAPELRVRLQSYADGEPVDFTDVPVHTDASSPFRHAVISAVRNIARGRTRTYGDVAAEAGSAGAARAVGQVMAANPLPLIIPCHRVVGAGGQLGGYSARTGLVMKRRLLAMERAPLSEAAECMRGEMACF